MLILSRRTESYTTLGAFIFSCHSLSKLSMGTVLWCPLHTLLTTTFTSDARAANSNVTAAAEISQKWIKFKITHHMHSHL
jgi:hypothetical protein